MNIMLLWFLMAMHQNFFDQVDSGVQGYAEIPTTYSQPVEKPLLTKKVTVNKTPVIDMHTDEKDEPSPDQIIHFDLGMPEPQDEITHFDLGIPCPPDVCTDGE